MPYVSIFALAAAALVWILRSKFEARWPREFLLLVTGLVVVGAARLLLWISTMQPWQSRHPVQAELLRGLATELVGAMLSVVVIEWLLDRHRRMLDRSATSQIEVATASQLSELASVLRKIRKVDVLDGAARWSLDRVEKQLAETELTVLRMASIEPRHLGEIQVLLAGVSRLKDAAWDCHRWLDGHAPPEDVRLAWSAFLSAADDLGKAIGALMKLVSVPRPVAALGLGDGADVS